MMTEPPPSKDAGGSTSQWRIFDAYKAHQERSRAAEDQAKARSAAVARRGIGEPASAEDPAKVRPPNFGTENCLLSRGVPKPPGPPSVSRLSEKRVLMFDGCFSEKHERPC